MKLNKKVLGILTSFDIVLFMLTVPLVYGYNCGLREVCSGVCVDASYSCDCSDACGGSYYNEACEDGSGGFDGCSHDGCDNSKCGGSTSCAEPGGSCGAGLECCGSGSSATCNECCVSGDCPSGGCTAWSNYCSSGDVRRSRTCTSYSCSGGSCSSSSSTQDQLVDDCGSDSCGSWGSDFCRNGDVQDSRSCTDRGCSGGSCYSSSYTDYRVVDNCVGREHDLCSAASCSNFCTPGGPDNDGDGFLDDQDPDCPYGGCGECTSGECCDVATGCYLSEFTSCGDPADDFCNNPDSCNAVGVCVNRAEVQGLDCLDVFECSSAGDDGYDDLGAEFCEAACDGVGNCDFAEDCEELDSTAAGCDCAFVWVGQTTSGTEVNCCGDDGGSDNFYYADPDDLGGSEVVDCERCDAGSHVPSVTLRGNGNLDDVGDECFYGDITCNSGNADDGSSEECNDACVGDDDGGACSVVHDPTVAENCDYTDTCVDDVGCVLTSDGVLRQFYCDECTDLGVVPEDDGYCPTPGTPGAWVGFDCYSYLGGSTQTCTGGVCDLDLSTTGCSAVNSDCCSGSQMWTGVSCDMNLGALGSSVNRDDSEAFCLEDSALDCFALNWTFNNESVSIGEYGDGFGPFDTAPNPRHVECCGDDLGEYPIDRTDPVGGLGCCDAPTDCIDALGVCRVGYENDTSLCNDGIDNDCDGNIDTDESACYGDVRGTVWDGDNIVTSWIVDGALVSGEDPEMPGTYVDDYSDSNGDYYIANAFVGTYEFRARKEGFQDGVATVTVLSDEVVDRDFWLYRGVSCNADCTDQNGYCNPNCDGLVFDQGSDSCVFVHEDCAGRDSSFEISYVDSGVKTIYTCCEGPVRTEDAMLANVAGNKDNLYDYKRLVKIGLIIVLVVM